VRSAAIVVRSPFDLPFNEEPLHSSIRADDTVAGWWDSWYAPPLRGPAHAWPSLA